ncbi:hypothetical protein ACOME3_002098 [Neoechinorhynchus agilis]
MVNRKRGGYRKHRSFPLDRYGTSDTQEVQFSSSKYDHVKHLSNFLNSREERFENPRHCNTEEADKNRIEDDECFPVLNETRIDILPKNEEWIEVKRPISTTNRKLDETPSLSDGEVNESKSQEGGLQVFEVLKSKIDPVRLLRCRDLCFDPDYEEQNLYTFYEEMDEKMCAQFADLMKTFKVMSFEEKDERYKETDRRLAPLVKKYFSNRIINKDQYKEILRKLVKRIAVKIDIMSDKELGDLIYTNVVLTKLKTDN